MRGVEDALVRASQLSPDEAWEARAGLVPEVRPFAHFVLIGVDGAVATPVPVRVQVRGASTTQADRSAEGVTPRLQGGREARGSAHAPTAPELGRELRARLDRSQ